jgi:branched-chain amino acid transport system ATP-binding protein
MSEGVHLLRVEGLTRRFGGVVAVNAVDLHVNSGEVVGLIGPNGAGKTTLFNMVTGFLKPSAGKVHFSGIDITGLPPIVVACSALFVLFKKLQCSRMSQLSRLFVSASTASQIPTWSMP